jgi:hypothetical protein
VDERQAGPGHASRRAGLRPLPTPTDVELYVADAPPLLDVVDQLPEPRIADLDALLREVDQLRSTLRQDLSLAAAAAEAGADDLAGWLLLGEDGQIRAFEERALAHLATATAEPATPTTTGATEIPTPRRAHRMLPAAPLVAAAAAIVGFLTGVVPGGGTGVTAPKTSNAALQSYAQLARLASSGASPRRLGAAAAQFHADLAPLMSSAGTNPAAAEKAIALLQSERAVISGEGDSPELLAVLAQADALVRRLQATLPRHPARPAAPLPTLPRDDTKRASAAPKSSPAAKPTPSPAPTRPPAPRPSPSATPKPTPSPSDAGGIPHPPGTLHS